MLKSSTVKAVEKKVKHVKEETMSVNDQINSDMLALGLESNIPKISAVLKKRVGLDLKEEEEKRRKEKARLNIVVIGKANLVIMAPVGATMTRASLKLLLVVLA